MKCVNAESLFLQIDAAIKDVDSLSMANPPSDPYLAKFLVVFISGLYEQSIEEIMGDYAALSGSPEIENYIRNQLDKTFRNPDPQTVSDLVKRFSTAWSTQLRALDNKHALALDGIVTNKNNLAHGIPVALTVADVKSLHNDAKVYIEKIDELLL